MYAMVFLKDSIRIREERLLREAASEGTDLQKEKVKRPGKLTTLEKLRQLFSLKNVKDGVR